MCQGSLQRQRGNGAERSARGLLAPRIVAASTGAGSSPRCCRGAWREGLARRMKGWGAAPCLRHHFSFLFLCPGEKINGHLNAAFPSGNGKTELRTCSAVAKCHNMISVHRRTIAVITVVTSQIHLSVALFGLALRPARILQYREPNGLSVRICGGGTTVFTAELFCLESEKETRLCHRSWDIHGHTHS